VVFVGSYSLPLASTFLCVSVVLSVPGGGGITGAGATTSGGGVGAVTVVLSVVVVCANALPVIKTNAAALANA
jgi:hypothetical protein